ncbi:arsenate reductase ArsC [Opitutales bacterium ASA1]|uniref:arsenate reductase ArsC n=1 Tax=Congregicoccus parvus TaxID=3081749 RepID=UPI002B2B40CF|nr:arsenate reductase ArsC [Opitutales bacterium ASA1]
MSTKIPYKVLFLCTGNSARSILAEHILRARSRGRFEVFSAGSHPAGAVNPFALQVLQEQRIDTSGARSKSWDELRGIAFDFVITVCDKAKETCPVWPGQPVIAHWGSPDPAAAEGDDEAKLRVFRDVANQIAARINIFCAFRDEQLDEWNVRRIGEQFTTPGSSA